MWNGLLPIGSVVSIQGGSSRLMILASGVVMDYDHKKVYDYCSCPFPQGFSNHENMIMFNRDAIEDIYCVGYLSPEGEEYRKRVEENIKGLRDGTILFDSNDN